ncbi:MAG: MFS transporter [Patescibacteria group bacterium]
MSLLSNTFAELPSLLQNRRFKRLWISQGLGQVATNILHFALVLRTFSVTGSSFFVGVLIAVISLPPILFSTVGGVIADRYDRRTILSWIHFSRVLLSLILLPFLDYSGVILLVVFLLTTLSEFFIPTESAALPSLVPSEHLVEANSLFAFTYYFSFLIGYSIAGPLLHWGGASLTLMSVSALYIGAGISTIRLPPLNQHLIDHNGILRVSTRSVWAQLFSGITFIRTHRLLPLLIVEASLVFGIERGIVALLPVFAFHILALTPLHLSLYLVSPLAAGTIVGVFVVNRMKHRISPPWLMHAGIVCEACALFFLLPFITLLSRAFFSIPVAVLQQWFAFGGAFIAGVGNVLVVISMQTFIQRETLDENRGKVFGGLLTVMNAIGLPIILLLSHLGSVIPLAALFAWLSLFTFLMGVMGLLFVRVHTRKIFPQIAPPVSVLLDKNEDTTVQ